MTTSDLRLTAPAYNEETSPYLICVVLPLLQKLSRECGRVSSRVIGELLGRKRRAAYNWLNALRKAGLARLQGKHWVAVKLF